MSDLKPIEPLILTLRGQRVILDVDLAELYGVDTRTLNQAVKRKSDRFPEDFMFQITSKEWNSLKSQSVISNMEVVDNEETNRSQFATGSRGGRRSPPFAFTEHGAILNSPEAVSVFVVRGCTSQYSCCSAEATVACHNSQWRVEFPMKVRFIDLFCGIGGFRHAVQNVADHRNVECECVFSSDIDEHCQRAYAANFGDTPVGDITKVDENDIPDHDLLLAGFPCQPFSIIGQMKGFEDTRGTLFFDIARILAAKQPKAFVLENVKLLRGHDDGKTLETIMTTLSELGYCAEYRVLNALDFGLPQKRERIWIVGFKDDSFMQWPIGGVPMVPLSKILEKNVGKKHFASDYIREKRHSVMSPAKEPTIWHENKAGNISAYPFSCALRAGASYNYLLVDGKRRLTSREMLRLQGFPEKFKIACSDYQTRKQAGNSLPVNVATAVLKQVFSAVNWGSYTYENDSLQIETRFLEDDGKLNEKAKTKNS